MDKLVFICFIFATLVAINEAAVAIAQAEVGKPYRLNFGDGNFVIRRRTNANKDPQFIFASPNQDGSWTTNGVDKIPSTARLFFNGTMVFDNITEDDLGSYDLPLEKPHIVQDGKGGFGMVGPSLIELQGIPQMPP
uniref:Uncharacterized protein n=1 Tax=Acrobeloides nanus TaxID=290746 RepID=A0A914CLV0_9BILA